MGGLTCDEAVRRSPFTFAAEEVEAGAVFYRLEINNLITSQRVPGLAGGGPCAVVEPARGHGGPMPVHAPCACIRPRTRTLKRHARTGCAPDTPPLAIGDMVAPAPLTLCQLSRMSAEGASRGSSLFEKPCRAQQTVVVVRAVQGSLGRGRERQSNGVPAREAGAGASGSKEEVGLRPKLPGPKFPTVPFVGGVGVGVAGRAGEQAN
ncbi:hypothetical protein EJ04DRAFT_524997 [Polyplosphaeria fusca]|uniref:Uncharacterized protein n=1 Tax=Polyplosphaeria fusca TaxID=682080 RepID=A0A9P4QWQ5_9PLEO|nr:hypothetical protein EJ04DRAFT_524997 [Polyplosphaeria fusca]